MKMNQRIELVFKFLEVSAKADARGMKISKAAAKSGLDSVTSKGFSVIRDAKFITDADGMVNAAATIGISCMTGSSESYRYWAETTVDGLKVMAVVTYKDARCLVRLDNMTFCQAYGTNAGELICGLSSIGYTQNHEEFSEGLKIPKALYKKVLVEKTSLEQLPAQVRCSTWTNKGYFSEKFVLSSLVKSNWRGQWFHKETNEELFFLKPAEQKTRAVMRTVLVKEQIKKPYHDGIRQFL